MLSSLGNRWERIPIEPTCHLIMEFLNDRWKTIASQEKVGNLHSRPVCCEEEKTLVTLTSWNSTLLRIPPTACIRSGKQVNHLELVNGLSVPFELEA
jgi:hypothetical protein